MCHRLPFVTSVAAAALMAGVLPARPGSTEAETGLEIVSVTATACSVLLSPTKTNVVVGSRRLGFRIVVRNAGRVTRRSVRVAVSVQQVRPTRRSVTITTLAPGASKTVIARNFGAVAYAQKLKLRVTARTPKTVSSRTYSVIFVLPPP